MSSKNTGQLLDRALQFAQSGALPEAERLYRRILSTDPATADAWNNLALICFQDGRIDEAAKAAERATLLRPNIAQYRLTRGNIAVLQQRVEDALSDFTRAITLKPDFAEAFYRRALLQHHLRNIESAVADYRAAAKLAPQIAEIHFQLAEALSLDARWQEAMQAYEAAFRRDAAGVLDRRSSMECLGYLQFDAMPEFWIGEITRFIARKDIEKIRYATLLQRVLLTQSAFRQIVDAASQSDFNPAAERDALATVAANALFRSLLSDAIVIEPRIETFLTALRKCLLFDESLRLQMPLEFLAALALQCFNNEYVFAQSDEETAAVSALRAAIDNFPDAAQTLTDAQLRQLSVCAMYCPLHELAAGARLPLLLSNAQAFKQLLERSVSEVAAERGLRAQIDRIVEIGAGVSTDVRNLYEENPYPRWFSIDRIAALPFAQWLLEQTTIEAPPPGLPAAPRILIAGCGTGMDALWLATGIADAQLLAVDLSLSSLSYARRKADELGIRNITFKQADILHLGSLGEQFDFIWSTGVLHHMQDPAAGLRVLLKLLRPGGLFKIGLYSEPARTNVNAARAEIQARGLAGTAPVIRAFRQQVAAAAADSPLRPLLKFRDFYSMSACRDLLFHVQEHQYRLPQLAAMLDQHNLTVIGASDLMPHTLSDYRRMFPGDTAACDLKNWDRFEQQYPDSFVAMYQFWCRYLPATDAA